MNKAIFRTKGFIGVILVAVLIIVSVQAKNLMAAGRIDSQIPITITAEISNDDTSTFATVYNKTLDIRLYKIADMDETGKVTKAEGFSDINLDILQGNPSVDDIKREIVEKAIPATANVENYQTITLDRSIGESSKTETMTQGAGIYLYVPQPVSDERYNYTFTSYVLFAPSSQYIMEGTGSDEWDYDVSFAIKSEATERYGNLAITKTLDTFNISLGDASFVYQVTAVLDNEVVLDNVYSIDFSKSGSQTRTINNIPATASVTVTEVYTGASYEVIGDRVVSNLTIIADDTVTADFENDYDGRLISGGISAENQFQVDEDGYIYWINQDGNPEPQQEIPVVEVMR